MEILYAIAGILSLIAGACKLFGIWFAKEFPGLASLTRDDK